MDKVKEQINDRLEILRTCLKDREKDDWGYIDPSDTIMEGEVLFLERLLKTVEKRNG